MLCVLFLAIRMRAVQLTQGETEKYDLPQYWVKIWMQVCTWSVLASTIFAIVMAAAFKEREKNMPAQIVRYIIMLGIYIGIVCCCVGAYVMEPPKEIWGDAGGPKVSPTAQCVMDLCLLYFATFLGYTISTTMNDLMPGRRYGFGLEMYQFARESVMLA